MSTETHIGKTARPVVATLVAIVREGQILLVRRGNCPDQGRWAFPGGKIRFGETIEVAAARELLEETGVHARALGVFTAVDVLAHTLEGILEQHFVLIGLLCEWQAGDPVAGDDAVEARWFSPDELRSIELARSFDIAAVAGQAVKLMALRSAASK